MVGVEAYRPPCLATREACRKEYVSSRNSLAVTPMRTIHSTDSFGCLASFVEGDDTLRLLGGDERAQKGALGAGMDRNG